MGDLAVVMPQGLSPKGLPLALKPTCVDADVPRLAAARTRHKEGREELGKSPEGISGEGLRGVALGKCEDSLEANPEILASSAAGTRRGMRSSADPTGDLSRGGPRGTRGRHCVS
jgi:hypothetical protein